MMLNEMDSCHDSGQWEKEGQFFFHLIKNAPSAPLDILLSHPLSLF